MGDRTGVVTMGGEAFEAGRMQRMSGRRRAAKLLLSGLGGGH